MLVGTHRRQPTLPFGRALALALRAQKVALSSRLSLLKPASSSWPLRRALTQQRCRSCVWQAGLIESLYKGEYEDVVQCKECGHYSPKPGATTQTHAFSPSGPFGSGVERVRLDPAWQALTSN